MLLIVAVAHRWCSGGRSFFKTTTPDGINRNMLTSAGMTDRTISRISSVDGVRATAAGAAPAPAGIGAGAAVDGAAACVWATTTCTAPTMTATSPRRPRPTTRTIESLDIKDPPLLRPFVFEREHLAVEDLAAADIHEELDLIGHQLARGRA